MLASPEVDPLREALRLSGEDLGRRLGLRAASTWAGMAAAGLALLLLAGSLGGGLQEVLDGLAIRGLLGAFGVLGVVGALSLARGMAAGPPAALMTLARLRRVNPPPWSGVSLACGAALLVRASVRVALWPSVVLAGTTLGDGPAARLVQAMLLLLLAPAVGAGFALMAWLGASLAPRAPSLGTLTLLAAPELLAPWGVHGGLLAGLEWALLQVARVGAAW